MPENNDPLFHVGHRQRLRDRLHAGKLDDAGILELALTYAIPRRDVRILARTLVHKYGGLHQVFAQSYEQLTNIDKLSDRTATLFKLIHNATLAAYRHDLSAVPVFHNQTQLLDYLRVMLGSAKNEECHILYLDDACRLIVDDTHSAGTNNWAAVYPREILKRAMAINAKQIIMVHNHPSYAEPFSADDVTITQEVMDLLKPVGIVLNDHYLVCADKVFSMRNSQLIR